MGFFGDQTVDRAFDHGGLYFELLRKTPIENVDFNFRISDSAEFEVVSFNLHINKFSIFTSHFVFLEALLYSFTSALLLAFGTSSLNYVSILT